MMNGGNGKVVFVGGTAFSGSTMFDMILANDPNGFSCGEVEALFYPFRRHHLAPVCGCGESRCDLWRVVYRNGRKRLYETIFGQNPKLSFIVDSSKSTLWIRSQSQQLRRDGIDVRNILIWKTPEEFRKSRAKRGCENGWLRTWVNYHRQYFSYIGDWKSVPYADLVTDPGALKAVCRWLDIPWFAAKEQFWRHRHHTLFGNTSAKIHLYNTGSEAYRRSQQELRNTVEAFGSGRETEYRTIGYSGGLRSHDLWESNRRVSRVLDVLRANDVRDETASTPVTAADRMAMPGLYSLYRRTRQGLHTLPYRALAEWMR